jgi:hypothetical protein
MGEANRLKGNYLSVVHRDSIPYVGMDTGKGYQVIAIYKEFGIIDVVVGQINN